MKLSTVVRWVGPVAIVSGVFTMISDLLGLTVYVPVLGEAADTGYEAVGAGVILIALMLLLIGMAGLYAGKPRPDGPRVIEIGYPVPVGEGAEQGPITSTQSLRPVAGRVAGRPDREHITAADPLYFSGDRKGA